MLTTLGYIAASEKILTLVVIFSFVLAVVWVGSAAGQKTRKLKLLEEALRSGAIDQTTKQEMVSGMLGNLPPFYTLGWLGLFVSGAMMLADGPHYLIMGMSMTTLGMLLFALSLGAVTLPFAARELHTRRRTATDPRSQP